MTNTLTNLIEKLLEETIRTRHTLPDQLLVTIQGWWEEADVTSPDKNGHPYIELHVSWYPAPQPPRHESDWKTTILNTSLSDLIAEGESV